MKRENSIEAYDNFQRASLSVAEAVRALEREGISLAGLCEACRERNLQTSSALDQARQDVRELTSSTGAIAARYDYDPYGRTTLVSGTNLSDKQYAGMYMHQTSGLYLTKYRAYDPNAARWLSRDPIAEAGGINLYGYVGNDPVYWTDHLGLVAGVDDAIEIDVAGGLAIGAGIGAIIWSTPAGQKFKPSHC